jgi:hypothetical protein
MTRSPPGPIGCSGQHLSPEAILSPLEAGRPEVQCPRAEVNRGALGERTSVQVFHPPISEPRSTALTFLSRHMSRLLPDLSRVVCGLIDISLPG